MTCWTRSIARLKVAAAVPHPRPFAQGGREVRHPRGPVHAVTAGGADSLLEEVHGHVEIVESRGDLVAPQEPESQVDQEPGRSGEPVGMMFAADRQRARARSRSA